MRFRQARGDGRLADVNRAKHHRSCAGERSAREEARLIAANRRAYRRMRKHMARDEPEYLNPTEQARLGDALGDALDEVATGHGGPVHALDVGCGGGNVTRHLLARGCHVTAADVSPDLVDVVARRYGGDDRLSTVVLDGRTLAPIAASSVDLVATYSVLHHVPDYLRLVGEMARVLRPGGVVVIDHELSPRYWSDGGAYAKLQEEARRSILSRRWWTPAHRRWQRMLLPRTWIIRARLMRDPRYQPGGDIHVWPDDHIDWDAIAVRLRAEGCEVLVAEDYLAYRAEYTPEMHRRYVPVAADMRILVARKLPLPAHPSAE